MENEIKEMLDNIRKIIKSNRKINFNNIIYDCDSVEKLLDYITNLQESEAYCYGQYKDCKSRIDKANEYIDKHTIEWKDDKFEVHNIMVKFNEYSNPQALKDILNGDE